MNPITTVKRTGKIIFQVAKTKSPKILLVVGGAAVVGGTVIACVKTSRLEHVLDQHQAARESLERACDRAIEDATEETIISGNSDDVKVNAPNKGKELIKIYAHTGWEVTKLYALPAGMIIFGMSAIGLSHGIMVKRNEILASECNMLMAGLNEYRERVRAKLGDKAESDLYFNTETGDMDLISMDENGKKHKTKQEVTTYNNIILPPTAQIMDANCPGWSNDLRHNEFDIQCETNWIKHELTTNGFVFENDIWKALNMPLTDHGQDFGWTCEPGDVPPIMVETHFIYRNGEIAGKPTPQMLIELQGSSYIRDTFVDAYRKMPRGPKCRPC